MPETKREIGGATPDADNHLSRPPTSLPLQPPSNLSATLGFCRCAWSWRGRCCRSRCGSRSARGRAGGGCWTTVSDAWAGGVGVGKGGGGYNGGGVRG